MPQYLALLQRDLVTISRSWVARGWLIVSAIGGLVAVMASTQETPSAAMVAAGWQMSYLLIWSIFIIVLTAGAVSSEAGVLADSVLSRPVKRYHYILAKLTARCAACLAIFLVVAGPVSYAAWRYAQVDDIHCFWDFAAGTSFVALAILMLASLGVALSSVLRSSLVAILTLALLWYAAGSIFRFLNASFLSPFELAVNLPLMFQAELEGDLIWKTPLGFLVPSIIAWLATIAHFNYKDV